MPVVFGEPQLIAATLSVSVFSLLYSLTTHSQDSGIQRAEDEVKHLLETPSGWKMYFDSQFQKVQFIRPRGAKVTQITARITHMAEAVHTVESTRTAECQAGEKNGV